MLLTRQVDSKIGDISVIEIPISQSEVGCTLRLWYWLSNSFYAQFGVYTRKSIGEPWDNIYSTINPTSGWVRIDVEIPEMKNFQVTIRIKRSFKKIKFK
jgi:hypothetical protein